MASANWNQETKSRLNDKISGNMNDLGSLARQIVRGSHSSEVSISGRKRKGLLFVISFVVVDSLHIPLFYQKFFKTLLIT